ncbi:MAG: hypothetical protein ACKN9D_01585 [Actinomycetales bacterium]
MSDSTPSSSGSTDPVPHPATTSAVAAGVQEAETILAEVPSRAEVALFIGGSIARTGAVLALIYISMALIPAQLNILSGIPLIGIVLGMVVYLFYTRQQLRKINTSRFPQVQAIETLIMMTAMFLALQNL